jgi:hypothetical protein
MNSSQTSQNISKNEVVQLPLPGFKMEVVSDKANWRKFIEMTPTGRIRIHLVKNS